MLGKDGHGDYFIVSFPYSQITNQFWVKQKSDIQAIPLNENSKLNNEPMWEDLGCFSWTETDF